MYMVVHTTHRYTSDTHIRTKFFFTISSLHAFPMDSMLSYVNGFSGIRAGNMNSVVKEIVLLQILMFVESSVFVFRI